MFHSPRLLVLFLMENPNVTAENHGPHLITDDDQSSRSEWFWHRRYIFISSIFLLKCVSSLFRICPFFSSILTKKRVFLSLTVFQKTSQKTFMLSLMISKFNCLKTYWKLWRVKNQSKKLTHFFVKVELSTHNMYDSNKHILRRIDVSKPSKYRTREGIYGFIIFIIRLPSATHLRQRSGFVHHKFFQRVFWGHISKTTFREFAVATCIRRINRRVSPAVELGSNMSDTRLDTTTIPPSYTWPAHSLEHTTA